MVSSRRFATSRRRQQLHGIRAALRRQREHHALPTLFSWRWIDSVLMLDSCPGSGCFFPSTNGRFMLITRGLTSFTQHVLCWLRSHTLSEELLLQLVRTSHASASGSRIALTNDRTRIVSKFPSSHALMTECQTRCPRVCINKWIIRRRPKLTRAPCEIGLRRAARLPHATLQTPSPPQHHVANSTQ
jgi:hypothetical protein